MDNIDISIDKIKFSVDKIDFVEDSKNTQFAVFKIYAFASGDNAHGLPVSVSTLKRTAHTIYNKPIVWKYQWFTDDAGGHEEDEVPCGFVYKENNPLKFKKLKDGRVMLIVNALIWKKYSGKLIDIFERDDSEKSVSVEMDSCEVKERKDGKLELVDFIYSAITILGEKISPAIPLAKAEVLRFSQDKEDYKKVYHEYFESNYKNLNLTIPKSVKNNVEKGFVLKNQHNMRYSTKIMSLARYLQNNEVITTAKVKNFCTYLPNFNFSNITETDPPTKDYIKSLLCGGENGVKWLNELHNQIIEQDSKIVEYFSTEDSNKTQSTLNCSDDEQKKIDIKEPTGKEDKSKIMSNIEFSNKTYNELREKFDEFLCDFKDSEGYSKYYVVDIMVDEPYVIVRDVENSKYLKVEYEDNEDGLTMYLEDAQEVKSAWTTEFSAGEKKEEEEEEEEKEVMMSEDKEDEDDDMKDKEDDEEEDKEGKEDEEDFAKEEKEEECAKEECEEEDFAKEDSGKFEKQEEESEEFSSEDDKEALNAQIEEYKFEINSLKEKVAELQEYKQNIESEKLNFEVQKTLNDVLSKCPDMPTSEVDALRENAKEFSLDNLDVWKNAVKAKAWTYATKETHKKDDVVKIALEYNDNKEQSAKKLWT